MWVIAAAFLILKNMDMHLLISLMNKYVLFIWFTNGKHCNELERHKKIYEKAKKCFKKLQNAYIYIYGWMDGSNVTMTLLIFYLIFV